MFAGRPHDRSFELFEHPEEYPGLSPSIPEQRVLRVWICPSFGPWTSWSVYARQRERLIRRVTLVGAGGTTHRVGATPHGADGYAPAEPIDLAIRALQSIVVPPFPAVADEGLDGTTYGVEREQLGAAARLEWWERPRLWETLAAWHDRTRTLLDGYLPAHRTGLDG
jgi:hypothetical protein